MKVTEWLRLSETKSINDLNDPSTTLLHAKIIQRKSFLKNLYIDFYNQFKRSISGNIENKIFVELGSGGGFIKDVISNVITSDVNNLPNVDLQFSATRIPYKDCTVDGFFMIDVLHHLSDSKSFFREANRCLKTGGKIVMIEPANTLWGRFIYQNFHHEPFIPSGGWNSEKEGPLSSANGAIPWIIFFRDRLQFEKEFPSLKIMRLTPHTPFSYIISGGISMRQLAPSFTYNFVKVFEKIISPLNRYLGMFLTIEIKRY